MPFDLLLENTHPGLVKFEMDLCWITKGGFDPVAYFEAWPGRFPMWHIKDLSADGEDADIGTGSVDFERAFAHADLAGLKHGFIERDNAVDPRGSVSSNYDAILPYWQASL